MFRLTFKVNGAVITFEKLNEIKQNEKIFFFVKFEIFHENHLPTRHIKDKIRSLLQINYGK